MKSVPRRPLAEPEAELPRMTLLEHLEELRRRIIKAVIAVGLAFCVCWAYAQEIFRFLEAPVQRVLPAGTKLAFVGVVDPFVLYMKVALLVGLFVASPIVLYQLWAFVAPGLYPREKRWAVPFIFFSTFFFVAGGLFAYYVAFPFAIEFLLGVGQDFQPVITVENYFSFLMFVILASGLMFELPVLIFLLSEIGVVTPGFLMRHFRWAILIIFIVAAVITPTPDIFNMCLVAVPGLGLYLLGVGAAWLVGRRRKRAKIEPLAQT